MSISFFNWLIRTIAVVVFTLNITLVLISPNVLTFIGAYLAVGSLLIAMLTPTRFIDSPTYVYLNHVGTVRKYLAYKKESRLLIGRIKSLNPERVISDDSLYKHLSIEQLQSLMTTLTTLNELEERHKLNEEN